MKQLAVEYFHFEQDFMEDHIRCIPMIVRFKLDACGIKLKLKEWSKMSADEREQLAILPIETGEELAYYSGYLQRLVLKHTSEGVSYIPPDKSDTSWSLTESVPSELRSHLYERKMQMTIAQWSSLSTLQRFALLKLTRSGHENKNFPKAMKEFGLA